MNFFEKNAILLFLVLSLFAVIFLGNYCVFNDNYTEGFTNNIDTTQGWKTYCQEPYGRCSTASKQSAWYPLPVYRKPYRWPYKFQTNYPFKHLTPLQ